MATERFSLAQILSVTTGYLLCDIGEVYEILNYMTQNNLFTHQLPRAGRVVGPEIVSQHPELADIDMSDYNKDKWGEWLEQQQNKFHAEYELSPIDNWEHRNPITELAEMVQDKPIVVLETGGSNGD